MRPIQGTQPVDAGNVAPAAPPQSDSLSFQRLLESLQRLAHEQRRATDGDAAGGAEQLQQALKAADDGFVTAMDLRQKLEAAFRSQRP